MDFLPSQYSVENVLQVLDLLTNPVDHVQFSIADRWLQEWKSSDVFFPICIQICQQPCSQYQSIFLLNALLGYLHSSFFSLSVDQKSNVLNIIVSLIPAFSNDVHYRSLLANALSIITLLFVEDDSMFLRVVDLLQSQCYWEMLLSYFSSLSEECFDDRFVCLLSTQERNKSRLLSFSSLVINALSAFLQSTSFLSNVFSSSEVMYSGEYLFCHVLNLWLSNQFLSTQSVLSGELVFQSLLNCIPHPHLIQEASFALLEMLEGSIPDSLVVDIGEWIVNCCPFKQENLFPAVYDYSSSNDSVSLVSFFRLVMGLIDKGLSMYFANPQCIIDQCFYISRCILTRADMTSLSDLLDCFSDFLMDHSSSTLIADNSHPIYQHLSAIFHILLQEMIIPVQLLQETTERAECVEMRNEISKVVIKLSHIVDEEESLEVVLTRIQENDPMQLEGLFFTLSCLCNGMEYLENEDLVNLLFSIHTYFSIPHLSYSLFTVLHNLSHAISTVPSLYSHIFSFLSQVIHTSSDASSKASVVFLSFSKYASKHFHSFRDFFYSILMNGVENVPLNAIKNVLLGCCSIAKCFQPEEEGVWLKQQYSRILQLADHPAVALSRLLTLLQYSSSTLDRESIVPFLLFLLPSIQEDDTLLSTWCECCLLVGRLLLVENNNHFHSLVEVLVNAVLQGSHPEFIRVLGDFEVDSVMKAIPNPCLHQAMQTIAEFLLQQSAVDANFTYCNNHLTILFNSIKNCAIIQSSYLTEFPQSLRLFDVAVRAISSYHTELSNQAISFLELTLVLFTESDIHCTFESIIQQCTTSILEHNSSHLLYETSNTALSLLYVLYSNYFQSFDALFKQVFVRVQSVPDWQEAYNIVCSSKCSIYQFNQVVLKMYNVLKVHL